MYRFLLLAFCLILILPGCGRHHEVGEVTLSSSGVTVSDPPATTTPLYWPAWRGPSGDGQVADQAIPTTWSDSENVVWRSEVPGRGHGSPIVVGDSIYLVTALEEEQRQQMLAYDRLTGELKWTTELHSGGFPAARSMHKKSTHANGTIASDGTRLYIAFLNSDRIIASAVDLDGEMVWQQEVGRFVSKFGYAPSPVLYRSLVIIAADNLGGGYLAALDGATGEIAWRVSRGNDSSYSSAAIARVGGKDQLLISGNNCVSSYDPETGAELWSTPCVSEATCGTVVSDGEFVFASGGYPERQTACLNAVGEIQWTDRAHAYEPSMALVDQYLVMVNDDGVAYCWNAASGELIWRNRLQGNFSASPIVANGLVYATNLNGETFVFSCADGAFEQVAKNSLGDDCYASPAVAAGQLFYRVGTGSGSARQEYLVCLAGQGAAE